MIEDYSNDIRFKVGQRVKVDIVHESQKDDVNCDTGTITGCRTRFAKTPKMRRIEYLVVFDEPMIKKDRVLINQVYENWMTEKDMKLLQGGK